MNKYEVRWSNKFKRDYKTAKKQGKDVGLLFDVIEKLAGGVPLPEKNKDHALSGSWSGYRECHLSPDWLLLYLIENDVLVLTLIRTGSHAKIFS